MAFGYSPVSGCFAVHHRQGGFCHEAGFVLGLVAELPPKLARGPAGREEFGPRMGGYSEYSQYSQYPGYWSLDQYFT